MSIAVNSLDQWRTVVNSSFVALDVAEVGVGGRPFRGSVDSQSFPAFELSGISASSHAVERTPRHVREATHNFYKLNLQVSGTSMVIQDGREALLQPGDFALYDTSRPFTVVHDGDFRLTVCMFSRDRLQLPVDAIGHLTAVRIDHDDALSRIVGQFFNQLLSSSQHLGQSAASRLGYTAIDLANTLLTQQVQGDARFGLGHRDRLRAAAIKYIDDNLHDVDLNPSSIAAAHFVSIRSLQETFQESATTVSREIRMRRLERCRRDLLDPLSDGDSVSAVAGRWGFHNAANFSRLFRSVFGESPSHCRDRS
ncbi:helix-turn-helix domain-containing protein [Aeromicrobium sp. 9AM]|uniref:AraC-like ligand-binding domain-containing protein n=1 Tax=Aeromicrobium sp. 9AM TaxID=2653126 RepID=UPI0012F0F338|nr:helix-turn-helix domain-containing protein [Aeromicrobium sp. 9AM]VXB62721.1 AraC family transcriptional regulator [Aeromicrobium sp. 9AM]